LKKEKPDFEGIPIKYCELTRYCASRIMPTSFGSGKEKGRKSKYA
jgi:hypothetical protein